MNTPFFMKINEIIKNVLYSEYRNYILENLQLADKVYFNTNKLSQDDREMIIGITNGDNYTKFIADVFYNLKDYDWSFRQKPIEELKEVYYQIKSYNKNVFPIKDFDGNINNIKPIRNYLIAIVGSLRIREKIISLLKNLPSIAIRNLKNEIREPRNLNELHTYHHNLEYFIGQISLLGNREPEIRDRIYKKMFKNNITLSQLLDFADEKENMIGGTNVTKNQIKNLANEHYDMTLVYENKNVLIVRVESPQAIKDIGCNSLWCFTYGSGFDQAWRQWNNYSTNDIVYVIFNFSVDQSSSEFMHVVIKPIDFDYNNSSYEEEEGNYEDVNDEKIYDMVNEPLINPINYLNDIMGLDNAKKILTFEWE